MAKARRGYQTIPLTLKKTGDVSVLASPRVADALKEIQRTASVYEGVKLHMILEAVYIQGHKDGAREAFEEIDVKIAEVQSAIPHRKPGRPKKGH
jgi:hypothetical protein